MQIPKFLRNYIDVPAGESPKVEEVPLKEEEEFDFSVLWADEEPGTFTLPHIVEIVFLFVILLAVFFK